MGGSLRDAGHDVDAVHDENLRGADDRIVLDAAVAAGRALKYEPQPGDERPLEEYILERATIARARGEQQVLDAVATARSKGMSWQPIDDILGTSAQAAQQRFGAAVESA